MNIPTWYSPTTQTCTLGRHTWNVARLFELSRHLPVLDIPLDHLCVNYTYEKLRLRDMVMHMKAVEAADLDRPIILDEDGELMDGRHRLMKAMLHGIPSIKAVRFDTNPEPDSISSE